MRLKPGQTAPQMPPRGPKGPMTNPGGVRAATMTGGPKPKPFQQAAAQQAAQQRAQRAATMTGGEIPGPRRPLNPFTTDSFPIRPGMRGAGAGTPQRQNTQSVMKAAMSGAGATPQRSFGAKKGGAVPSKMGAVKTSASRDGVAKKGKTKGRMI